LRWVTRVVDAPKGGTVNTRPIGRVGGTIRRRSAAVAAATILLVGCASGIDVETRPANLGTVVENAIYRGAQPTIDDWDALRELGIRTILKLNSSRMTEETTQARDAGMSLIHIPFEADTIGTGATCDDVARALDVLADESNWPVYVHCSRGRDRVGYVVGLYRQLRQGWTWPRIDDELAAFGHAGSLRRAYPQIASELEAGVPTCAVTLSSPHARSGQASGDARSSHHDHSDGG
jgi:protein tyrosine phosphatase (PTP) superfamily phosphohydrolase (DUF442 family)